MSFDETQFVPDLVSGPHMRLVAAMVKLARHDLADPELSVEARAFLRGEPYRGQLAEIDLRLFADVLGFKGHWETHERRDW